jgi:hypothetical protein
MNEQQQDMVAQFCGVTGANASSAQTAFKRLSLSTLLLKKVAATTTRTTSK